MPAVTLENLTKVFATGVKAVDALNLHVNDGEFVVLVGPSGCGKTTALRMVAGLEMITSGTVSFGDQVVNDVSPRHRDVAMVFQNYALYPHLTVYQNIVFALENKHVPAAERDRRVRETAEVLGLTDLLRRKPRQLSGGQRQRVAMGRAIVREPAVFLMDEPLSNLDAKLRVQMRLEVLRVHEAVGATTLYVTHDQTEAMTMGDRVAVLRDGMLQQFATPRELYDRPVNLFVATFIGSPEMNLYEASLEESGERLVVAIGSQRLGLPGQQFRPYLGRKVIVGIRPEDLGDPALEDRVGATAAGAHAGHPHASLTADARLLELLGSEQHVFFSLDATPVAAAGAAGAAGSAGQTGLLADSEPNGVARLDSRSAIRAGTKVTFSVDTERLHFFDPDTGRAIEAAGQ
jgi:multiple sugar transport system ATP-binding protein